MNEKRVMDMRNTNPKSFTEYLLQNMTISFFTPGYIDIVQKTGDRWIRLKTSAILNTSNNPYDPSEKYSKFGLTQMSILGELYKRYQGLDGWYLVQMAEKNITTVAQPLKM